MFFTVKLGCTCLHCEIVQSHKTMKSCNLGKYGRAYIISDTERQVPHDLRHTLGLKEF